MTHETLLASIETVDDAKVASAMLSPLRLRILEQLSEPGSASSLAPVLEMPRQKINYHLRELEKHGLVELVEERRKGNCVERLVQATARSWVISPAILGDIGADPDRIGDRFSLGFLIAVLARSIRELAALRTKADAAGKKLATLTIETEVTFSGPKARNAFAEELANAVAGLVSKYHDESGDPDSRRFRLLVGSHVIPKHYEEEEHHG